MDWCPCPLPDVCVQVSAVCRQVSGCPGAHLHVVQRPALASSAEDPLPVGGSCDKRGHLGHRPLGIRAHGVLYGHTLCLCVFVIIVVTVVLI